MPTENERKYVLNNDCDFEQEIIQSTKKHLKINQGYLLAGKGFSLRLREVNEGKFLIANIGGFAVLFFGDKKITYTMTYKSTVNGRVVEIEKKIDQRDFNDLWPQCMNKVVKNRCLLKQDGETWEIDFFKDHHNDTYFTMAEIEMPEGQLAPTTIPDIIQNNLIYEVPLTDCRFSSKLLGDIRYGIDMFKKLTKESNDGTKL